MLNKNFKLEKRNIMFGVFGVLCLLDYVFAFDICGEGIAHSIPYMCSANKVTLWRAVFIQCPESHSIWDCLFNPQNLNYSNAISLKGNVVTPCHENLIDVRRWESIRNKN